MAGIEGASYVFCHSHFSVFSQHLLNCSWCVVHGARHIVAGLSRLKAHYGFMSPFQDAHHHSAVLFPGWTAHGLSRCSCLPYFRLSCSIFGQKFSFFMSFLGHRWNFALKCTGSNGVKLTFSLPCSWPDALRCLFLRILP